jgi:tRNA(Glu) U13 pseudouridine synthase TruD
MVLEGLQSFVFNVALSRLVEKYGLRIPVEVSGRSGRLSLPGRLGSPPRVPLGFLPSKEFLLESRGEWAENVMYVLEDIGIELGDLRGVRSVPRPLVSAAELYLCRENRNGSVELSFALPKGSYASVFLRHYYRLIWLMDCLERIECSFCMARRTS